jgi:hypothetical protein
LVEPSPHISELWYLEERCGGGSFTVVATEPICPCALQRSACWLWVVVIATVTLFHVASGRSAEVLRHLLRADFGGIVGSDRLKTYRCLHVNRRQLCWAHLIRNLLALAERKGALGGWAADLLALADLMFGVWHQFRAGAIDRSILQAALVPIQAAMGAILERGQRRYDQAQGLSDELLTLWPALWMFAEVDGVEPTNMWLSGRCGRPCCGARRVLARRAKLATRSWNVS